MATEEIDVRLKLRDDLSKPLKKTEEQTRRTSEETEDLGDKIDDLDPKARRAAASLKRLEQQEKRLELAAAELAARQDKVAKKQEAQNKAAEEAAEKLRRQATFMGRLTERLRGGKRGFDEFNLGLNKAIFGLVAFRRVLTVIKIGAFITAINAAGAALMGLAAAAGGAVGSLGPLIGMFAAIPAAGFGAGLAMATIKTALSGIGDAVKVMADPASTIEEIHEATKNLSPVAKAFASEVANIKTAWAPVKDAVQEAMLPLLGPAMTRVTGTYFPMLERQLGGLGGLFGTLADRASRAMTTMGWQRDINLLMSENKDLTETWAMVFGRFGTILRDIMVSAVPMLRDLASWASTVSITMQDWFSSARKSGELTSFFNDSLRVLKGVASTTWDFMVGLKNVLSVGRSLGDAMGGSLADIAAQFRAWTESEAGRERLAQFFERMKPIVYALGSLLMAVGGALIGIAESPGVASLIGQLETDLLPALEELFSVVSTQLGPGLIDGATGLIELATAIAAGGLMDHINALIDGLVGFVEWLNKMPAPIQAVVVNFIAFAALMKVSGILPFVTVLGKLTGWLFKTAAGAKVLAFFGKGLSLAMRGIGIALRFMLGPWGLAIAAVIGLALYIRHLWKTNETFRQIVTAIWDKVLGVFEGVWNWLKDNWGMLLAILTGPFGLAVRYIFKNWDKIVAMFKNAPGNIARAASGLWDGITGTFKSMVNSIIGMWNDLDLTVNIPDAIPGLPDEWRISTPDVPLLRYAGGPVWPGQDFIVGELGPELLKTASGLQLIGANGPELMRPTQHGTVIPHHEVAAYVPQVQSNTQPRERESHVGNYDLTEPYPAPIIQVNNPSSEIDIEAAVERAYKRMERKRRERR